jgi:hypothetical protein
MPRSACRHLRCVGGNNVQGWIGRRAIASQALTHRIVGGLCTRRGTGSTLSPMTDFYTPVQIPRDAFDLLISRVDEAVGNHAIALVLNEDFPFRALDPIEMTSINFASIDLKEDPLDVVEYLDQLMYFAFEEAPREVIASWGNQDSRGLGDEAADRALFMRRNMPKLRSLWDSKSNALIPPLIHFEYDAATTASGDRYANIYFAASRISRTGAPDKSDMHRVRFQVWPSDVRLLIRELEHLAFAHLIDGDDEEGGEGSSADAD